MRAVQSRSQAVVNAATNLVQVQGLPTHQYALSTRAHPKRMPRYSRVEDLQKIFGRIRGFIRLL